MSGDSIQITRRVSIPINTQEVFEQFSFDFLGLEWVLHLQFKRLNKRKDVSFKFTLKLEGIPETRRSWNQDIELTSSISSIGQVNDAIVTFKVNATENNNGQQQSRIPRKKFEVKVESEVVLTKRSGEKIGKLATIEATFTPFQESLQSWRIHSKNTSLQGTFSKDCSIGVDIFI